MKGIGVSPGITYGKVLVKADHELIVAQYQVHDPICEVERLHKVKEKCKEQIKVLYEQVRESLGENDAKIFEAHLLILEDVEFLGQIEAMVNNDHVNAEWAVKNVTDKLLLLFNEMENEYMRERALDIKDVANRLIKNLLGIEVDLSHLDEEVILAAKDLTPSDTAQLDRKKVIGFITETGGRTSHSAIMARTLEIPAIVGVEGLMNLIKNGDLAVIDGDEGFLIINPSKEVINFYVEKRKDHLLFKNKLSNLIGRASVSSDGIQVELAANIGTPDDLERVLKNDAEGIGLLRSEFLYMDRNKLPSEEEQYEAYKIVAAGMNGKPVIIRTLDIGGDKELNYLGLPKELNPFLGYRAIRLCLDKVDIFATQLRALLRASAHGNIKIMFPMISSVEELKKAKKILEDIKKSLRAENVAFDEQVEVGIMIEIPAAAIISDFLAKEVDFFSIGTNDLIQYTVAVDRMNSKIAGLYNPLHPAVLRLIKKTIDNGHKEGIWVGMCGEAAGDPKLVPLLLGLGLDEFSMSPASILKARWIIQHVSQQEMKKLANQALNLATAEEIEQLVNERVGRI